MKRETSKRLHSEGGGESEKKMRKEEREKTEGEGLAKMFWQILH